MQTGIIRRPGNPAILGRWRADREALLVETDDPALRQASDRILHTPLLIPVHGPEHLEYAAPATPLTAAPTSQKFLALFALELEALGFQVEPDPDD